MHLYHGNVYLVEAYILLQNKNTNKLLFYNKDCLCCQLSIKYKKSWAKIKEKLLFSKLSNNSNCINN